MHDNPDKSAVAWQRHLKQRAVVSCLLRQRHRWQLQRYGSSLTIDCLPNGVRDLSPTAPVRVFDEYVLCHIWGGRGIYCAEGSPRDTRLHAGMLVVIPPGQAGVLAGIPQTGYHEDYVLFCGEVFDRMAAEGLLKPGAYPWSGTRFLPDILALTHQVPPVGHFRAVLQLQRLLLQLPQGKPAQSSPENRLHALMAEMAATPEHGWSIHDMADFCQCSESLLRRLFMEETGCLPRRYAEKVKLEEAARRLARQIPLEEIWQALGFCDRSHFSHRFKCLFGMTPGLFALRQRQHALEQGGA